MINCLYIKLINTNYVDINLKIYNYTFELYYNTKSTFLT
jgi:hypothetical protein